MKYAAKLTSSIHGSRRRSSGYNHLMSCTHSVCHIRETGVLFTCIGSRRSVVKLVCGCAKQSYNNAGLWVHSDRCHHHLPAAFHYVSTYRHVVRPLTQLIAIIPSFPGNEMSLSLVLRQFGPKAIRHQDSGTKYDMTRYESLTWTEKLTLWST